MAVFYKLLAVLAVVASLFQGSTAIALNANEKAFLDNMLDTFRNTGTTKSVTTGGQTVVIFSDRLFNFVEGILRALDTPLQDADLEVGARDETLQALLGGFTQFGSNILTFSQLADEVAADNALVALNAAEEATLDADTPTLSAILVQNQALAVTPNMFCLSDDHCKGQRPNGDKFPEFNTVCQQDGDNSKVCTNRKAFFTIRWLFVAILSMYVIFVCWACYQLYPRLKGKKKTAERVKSVKGLQPQWQRNDQIVINTLATQCASAENLLFKATQLMKQARQQKNLVTVEARRENRMMLLTVEYYQAVCSILVILSHQLLYHRTKVPGESLNPEEAAVRAIQLEIMNYVGNRISLAFQAEAFTEKSLVRIAEAYAILTKVTENLVLVGFDADKEAGSNLGVVSTPIVDLNENAFFVAGKAGSRDGSDVCLAMNGVDTRGLQLAPPNYYVTERGRDVKEYDPLSQGVTGKVGQGLNYRMNQAGAGDPSQGFVRSMWGESIGRLQGEASNWLRKDTNLDRFLEYDRQRREERAAPVLRKKKKKKGRGYAESAVSGANSVEGLSVNSSNNYVYNVQSVITQGLGIAGKPGIPYDRPNEAGPARTVWRKFADIFPNAAAWPKFHFIVFVLIPVLIMVPMLANINKGSVAIDKDGNVEFVARFPAGFGTSFLGVPPYYFLDGFVPEANDLEVAQGVVVDDVLDALNNDDPFGNGDGAIFISNADMEDIFDDFNALEGRLPDAAGAEIQAGVLAQANVEEIETIQDQQARNKVFTPVIYALMHVGAYYFTIIPISLCRESLELLGRRFTCIRAIFPLSLWRDVHMTMGMSALTYVTLGATVFCIMMLNAMGNKTPFAGLSGDPNFANFFDLNANVLYLRQLLLPAVPTLLLMKYAGRGPPLFLVKYGPTFVSKWYWEICYFFHYVTTFTSIIMLVLYRPQVFYWMGATWGFLYGGNKIVRILRTRKCTVNKAQMITYTVEDKRNNAKKRVDVLRLTINVPKSFPDAARGQAVWLLCPEVDWFAHPFTIAKTPTPNDSTITLHIGVKYLAGDDIISYARPDQMSMRSPMAKADNGFGGLPPGWKSAVDPESGQTYYYNSAARRTTWNRPQETGFDKLRALTGRFSTNVMNMRSSTAALDVTTAGVRGAANTSRATWTQKLAKLGEKITSMDEDMRRNANKDYPIYVSSPLGTSMDDTLVPSLPGSVIISTQNGLPAAESSVRWLLQQPKNNRPKFHFFVSVSREVNDALSVLETLRDSMIEAVKNGNISIDGLNPKHSHMADWLGVYINLSRRRPDQIEGDRDMLLRSMNPPSTQISRQKLDMIETWLRNRIQPGRLKFDRFLKRVSEMVQHRTGDNKVAVGYCGSAKVAYSIRKAAAEIKNMSFDGEYI